MSQIDEAEEARAALLQWIREHLQDGRELEEEMLQDSMSQIGELRIDLTPQQARADSLQRRVIELEAMLQAGVITPPEARNILENHFAINELARDIRPLPLMPEDFRNGPGSSNAETRRPVKEFDRGILKRIGDALHELMPNVDISTRNASMDVIQRDVGSFPVESKVLPGAKFVETWEIFVLKMEIKFTATDPADFLREADLPKEEVSRVFRMEDGK